MDKIRTVIVDDESPARRRIRELLDPVPDVEVVAECTGGPAAVEQIRTLAPDLLFLDVQMPELDGFGVLAALGLEATPVTVFITAYDHYALKAFDVHALDYLLKPYSDERFEQALDRARTHLATRQRDALNRKLLALLAHHRPDLAASTDAPTRLDRLVLKTGGRVLFLKVEEIDWIDAAGVYVNLHAGGKTYLHRETLGGLENRLDPVRFVRIHRSTIVNLDRIRELQPYFHGEYVVVLHDGTKLKLSRTYRARLQERLGQAL